MTCRWLVAGCCPGAKAGARGKAGVGHDPFEMVRRFGTQVVEVERLRDPAVYVREHDVALVRKGLSPACQEAAASLLLSAALSPSSPSRRRLP